MLEVPQSDLPYQVKPVWLHHEPQGAAFWGVDEPESVPACTDDIRVTGGWPGKGGVARRYGALEGKWRGTRRKGRESGGPYLSSGVQPQDSLVRLHFPSSLGNILLTLPLVYVTIRLIRYEVSVYLAQWFSNSSEPQNDLESSKRGCICVNSTKRPHDKLLSKSWNDTQDAIFTTTLLPQTNKRPQMLYISFWNIYVWIQISTKVIHLDDYTGRLCSRYLW